ncbi:two-component sensor histidine kinase [Streptomyces sp. WAC 06738]|uniref:sensor histidine kinase n=1 Tax=Streptomyces sp. WAC 06738 TaxID=2203210 RepID=UPI000F6BD115|nr:histidine kinase [Streptomyces sp. WAC 06738]AZM50947.1 two-component sensor histidine kinase [Streptomyces sp. WAC 06738]
MARTLRRAASRAAGCLAGDAGRASGGGSRRPAAGGVAPPRPSRWVWTADVALALVLSVGTVVADLDRSYYEPRGDGPQQVAPRPPPPGLPGLPGLPEDGPPTVPEPGSRGVPEPGRGGTEGPRGAEVYPPPVVEHVLPPVRGWELVLGALTALPLAVRRRYPLVALWAVLGAAVTFHLGEVARGATAFAFAAGVVAAYSAVMYSPYRRSALVSVLAGVPLFAAAGVVPEVGRGFLPLLVLLPVGLAANAIHTWQQRVRALQEEQAAATRLAVDQERSRIARELHDVVTHNVSMMTIQAGAARKVLDTSPEQAREAMRAVEAGGRAAMAELRHVMGLLTMAAADPAAGPAADPAADPTADPAARPGPAAYGKRDGGMTARGADRAADPASAAGNPALAVDLAPQPGLGQLAALAGRVRDTGVPVELSVTGDPEAPLPAGVDLAAYRVVQEALTNAVKHAAGAAVAVSVAHAPGELRVEVTDTGGPPAARAAAGSGRGLIGLRERLAVYGGTLHAAPRPRGGYRVRALIPLPDGPPLPDPAGPGRQTPAPECGDAHAPGRAGGAMQT